MDKVKFETIRDDRGNTIVMSLNGRFASVWYNRTERSWVAYRTETRDGAQTGSSDYVYSKDEAINAARLMLDPPSGFCRNCLQPIPYTSGGAVKCSKCVTTAPTAR